MSSFFEQASTIDPPVMGEFQLNVHKSYHHYSFALAACLALLGHCVRGKLVAPGQLAALSSSKCNHAAHASIGPAIASVRFTA